MRRHPLLAAWVIAAVLWQTGNAQAPSPLSPYTARYRLTSGGMLLAETRVTLRITGEGTYRYHSQTVPAGLVAALRSDRVTEQSSGRIRGCQVIPDQYRYRHEKGTDPALETELAFDWPGGRVANHSRGSHWRMDLPPGTQDKFSQQLQLMLRLGEVCRGDLAFPVADGGRLKHYRFRPDGEETVETPAGRFPALRLTRSKNGKAAGATLWLAPELGYLPVKIEKRDTNGEVSMELREFTRERVIQYRTPPNSGADAMR
ncbi:MAG TPA: DUF3108 domain-containing protein [Sedimenticola sp.]|nr:DUF3108 domain-containing protein [Sedimenticola sp.]